MFILRRLCSFLRRTFRRRPNAPVIIRPLATTTTTDKYPSPPPIRIATFNVAMFSMAPAAPNAAHTFPAPAKIGYPKSILKRKPTLSTSERRSVSINLPGNQITVEKSMHLGSAAYRELHQKGKGKAPALPDLGFVDKRRKSEKSVLQVLLEVGADVLALQNVKAEEEKGMRPLADLAEGLGMTYVFAESWAPQFGNAILSKWPVKKSTVLKICDGNVLKVSIQVPRAGEVSLYCTHLDHLNEEWRMKQISAIIRSSDGHHILAGGLNALDKTDYSGDRWNDVVKYSEENGKPRPKTKVMRFLKGKRYIDAKDFAGECEAVVVVAKGQDVQGTCKCGTRVDYILASPDSPYMFIPGSYRVMSSKGTSNHHIVKVDIVINNTVENSYRKGNPEKKIVKMDSRSTNGIWKIH